MRVVGSQLLSMAGFERDYRKISWVLEEKKKAAANKCALAL